MKFKKMLPYGIWAFYGGAVFWYAEYRWYWCLFWAIACPLLMYSITLLVPECLPIRWQRPFYKRWKKKALQVRTGNPLIDYPLVIWITFNMDAEFEKGGIRGARKALLLYIKDISEQIVKALN